MLGIHDTLSAGSLVFCAFVILGNHIGLEVAEQDHISPFLEHAACLGGSLVSELQLIPVIGIVSIRLIERLDLSVCRDHYIDSGFDHIRKPIEKSSDLLFQLDESFAITEVGDAEFLRSVTDRLDRKLLHPIECINYECLARLCPDDLIDLLLQHLV